MLGVSLSVAGLWAGWNILAKATLGVVASILLAATTEPRVILIGAQRLRLPSLLVQIAMFMLRYMDVIMDEMRRMRVARESRGFEARNFRHIPVIATVGGRAVHPLVRTGRAGASRDAQPRLFRADADDGRNFGICRGSGPSALALPGVALGRSL